LEATLVVDQIAFNVGTRICNVLFAISTRLDTSVCHDKAEAGYLARLTSITDKCRDLTRLLRGRGIKMAAPSRDGALADAKFVNIAGKMVLAES